LKLPKSGLSTEIRPVTTPAKISTSSGTPLP
jgi:hypothetical protein